MPDGHDGEVGWCIVGFLMMKGFAAVGAMAVHPDVFFKQRTCAAGRAAFAETPEHGLPAAARLQV